MRRSRARTTAIAALLGALSLVVSACASLSAATPNEAGEIVVTLSDNRISPSVIQLEVGQRVRLVIENVGKAEHEFMVGTDPIVNDNYLVDWVYEPFATDFFALVEDVRFSGAGMAMNFENIEMDMDMEMDGDPMAGDEGMGEEEPHGEEEGVEEGGMVMLPGILDAPMPGEAAVLEFTVTEAAIGTWEIACFRESGQHYADGMKGTLIVNG